MVQTADDVVPSPNGDRPIPEFIKVTGSPRFSANQLRHLKALTGMAMEDLMGDAATVMQAYVYTQLQREGYDVSWEVAGDIPLEFDEAAAAPDPSSTGSVTDSPPSAGSGA